MLKCFISICCCFIGMGVFSQKKPTTKKKKDTITYKTNYGLRIGADISKPIIALFDNEYSGFELVADYRITNRWYIATEFGYDNQTTVEDFTNSTAKGSFVKLGANYNAYDNWLDMNNEIFTGFRYGFATFQQTLNSYTPNVGSSYFPSSVIKKPITETGLNAHWLEFQLGLKAEVLKNVFVSVSAHYKTALKIDNQKGFKTLYAPGFERVYVSNTGFSFNYTIAYLIPFSKK